MGRIYILPIGDFDEQILTLLLNKIPIIFSYECRLLSNIEIPEDSFDLERSQYSSKELLKHILDTASEDAQKIIGVTSVDLFTPILTYVFGQAQLGGRAAVVSSHRLRQEFYGLPPNKKVLIERLIKEAVHELGHTFGLVHCHYPKCAMHFSNSVMTIDRKTDNFCESCANILTHKI